MKANDQTAVSQDTLQTLAARHGFDDVRVTDASDHVAARATFAAWLAGNHQADMDWLNREPARRSTPGALVPDAQSVLTLAINYYREQPALAPGYASISRYAAGLDYHLVMEKGMKHLIHDLKHRLPGAYRYYVDYGPVLERAFAERAGLGFIGRSANLIHPRFGTYVFLATIITDAPFAPTAPGSGTCGQCTRCMDVCPTGALKSPYVVDANLCISYLTIENRGPIPRHLRPLIGSWLFGCDLCQEVCPYNDRARTGSNVGIAQTTLAGTQMDVADLLAIRTDEDFSRQFSQSPLKRAKRAGLLRNAAVVAGNLLHEPLIPALKAASCDAHELVRGHAVWALAQYGERDFIAARMDRETHPFVQEEMAAAT